MNLKFITRIKHGYWVRIFEGHGKNQHPISQKSFVDSKYKSQEDCLRAAIKFRNKELKRLELTYTLNHHRGYKKVRNVPGSTGIVGVTLYERFKGGNYTCGYRVNWREDGKNGERINKSKSWAFCPEDKKEKRCTLEKAIKLRNEMEALHYNPR